MGNKSSTKTNSSVLKVDPHHNGYGFRRQTNAKQLNLDFSFDTIANQSVKTVVVSGYSNTFYNATNARLMKNKDNTYSYSAQNIHFEHVEYGGRSFSDAKAVLEHGTVVGLMINVQDLHQIYSLNELLADYEYVFKANEQSGKHLIPIVVYVDAVVASTNTGYNYNTINTESNAMETLATALNKYENWQVVYGDETGKALTDALDYFLSFY